MIGVREPRFHCTLYVKHMAAVCANKMLLSTGFVAIGTAFDVAVWSYAKNLKIFDEAVELEEVENTQSKTVIED
jgi:hypothetical protein